MKQSIEGLLWLFFKLIEVHLKRSFIRGTSTMRSPSTPHSVRTLAMSLGDSLVAPFSPWAAPPCSRNKTTMFATGIFLTAQPLLGASATLTILNKLPPLLTGTASTARRGTDFQKHGDFPQLQFWQSTGQRPYLNQGLPPRGCSVRKKPAHKVSFCAPAATELEHDPLRAFRLFKANSRRIQDQNGL